jgi:hypothetical protein
MIIVRDYASMASTVFRLILILVLAHVKFEPRAAAVP